MTYSSFFRGYNIKGICYVHKTTMDTKPTLNAEKSSAILGP